MAAPSIKSQDAPQHSPLEVEAYEIGRAICEFFMARFGGRVVGCYYNQPNESDVRMWFILPNKHAVRVVVAVCDDDTHSKAPWQEHACRCFDDRR